MAATLLTVATKSIAGHQSGVSKAIDRLPPLMTNVGSGERTACLVGGAALLGYGVARGGLLSSLLGGYLVFRGATGHCPVRQAMGTSNSDATAPQSVIAARHGRRVDASVYVNRLAHVVYDFWRDFENLPRFMSHLEDVDTTTDNQSRWTAKGPLGVRVQWEAVITADVPGRLIAWKSLRGADVDTAGSVHFTPKGNGTEVKVELKYDPPGGQLGAAFAGLLGEDPQRQIEEDLQKFRLALEATPAAV